MQKRPLLVPLEWPIVWGFWHRSGGNWVCSQREILWCYREDCHGNREAFWETLKQFFTPHFPKHIYVYTQHFSLWSRTLNPYSRMRRLYWPLPRKVPHFFHPFPEVTHNCHPPHQQPPHHADVEKVFFHSWKNIAKWKSSIFMSLLPFSHTIHFPSPYATSSPVQAFVCLSCQKVKNSKNYFFDMNELYWIW